MSITLEVLASSKNIFIHNLQRKNFVKLPGTANAKTGSTVKTKI